MHWAHHTAQDATRWTRWFDLFWALVGIALTAGFSVAVYFDIAGIGGFH